MFKEKKNFFNGTQWKSLGQSKGNIKTKQPKPPAQSEHF